MLFCGLSKVFSTVGDEQYEEIGAFWDELSKRFGRENLQGLGCDWTQDTLTYLIGLKIGALPRDTAYPGAVYREMTLPDTGWLRFFGKTEALSQLYAQIYVGGPLKYEIEQFSENGDCVVFVIRKENPDLR